MQTRNEFCIIVLHSAEWGLLGAVLVVQSDISRKEGPALPLLHTLGVYQSVAEGAAQCCESDMQGWDSCTTSDDSLSIILLSSTTSTGSRGHPRMELALLISLSSLSYLLLRCFCSSRLLHRKWLMLPQSHEIRSAPWTPKDLSFLSRWVCSDLFG